MKTKTAFVTIMKTERTTGLARAGSATGAEVEEVREEDTVIVEEMALDRAEGRVGSM